MVNNFFMYDKILLRYDEIWLKSEKTRRKFEKKLIENIKASLGKVNIEALRGRIIINYDPQFVEKLKKVFGIVSFSPAVSCKTDLKAISEKLVEFVRWLGIKETFAIRVKREAEINNITSMEIARILGKIVKDEFNSRVDLKNPQTELFVEIREEESYIFDKKIEGPGGFPISTQGKVLCLVSGGIDSAVSAWYAMKRGCEIVILHFDTTPFAQNTQENVKKIAKKLREWNSNKKIKIVVVKFGKILQDIREILKNENKLSYTCLLCKYAMYKVAEEIARKENAKALVTGDSLGQVASQTLDNLLVISYKINIPILRPLIFMDKHEIIEMAKNIGTFEISLETKRCKAVPKHPETKAKMKEFKKLYSRIKIDEYSLKTIIVN